MASKIIKQGTSRSLEIQQFLFSENCSESPRVPEQVQWPELLAEPTPQQKGAATAEFCIPEVDLTLVEKNAFENGFRQGEKSGMAMAEQKIETIVKRHAEAILEIGRMKSSLYAQVEKEVVKLAIEVAKKIIHREIQVDPDIIQTLIRVTLANVAVKNPVTIHVNPVDFNYISERQAELSQSEARNISIVPDKSIARGGCLVETDCGDIDARLEEKFHEVEHAFFEGAW
jgi:flagellar assembly protein FliH